MKKSLKIIAVTAILAVVMLFSLSGCTQTPYDKYLNTVWHSGQVEKAEYDYTYTLNEQELKGTLITKIFDATNKSFKINQTQYTDCKKGNYYEYKLTCQNDSHLDIVHAEVYFDAYAGQNFRPVHSYTYFDTKDGITQIELKYSTKKVTATVTTNGDVKTYTADLKSSLVYDNVELQAIARTLNFNQKGTLAFFTPIYESNKIYPKQTAMGALTEAPFNKKDENGKYISEVNNFSHLNGGNEFTAVGCLIQSNEKPSGLPQTLLVAKGKIEINGQLFNQPVIQITEGIEGKGLSVYTLQNMYLEEFNPTDFN